MTRVLTEGFEMGDLIALSATTRSSIRSTAPRSGVYELRVGDASAAYTASATLTLPSPLDEFYLRYASRSSNFDNKPLVAWRDSNPATLGYIRVNGATGRVDIYISTTLVATGTVVLSTDVDYVLEVHVKIAAVGGIIEVKVDGVLDVTYSGNTQPGTTTTVASLQWQALTNSGGGYQYVDDIAINSTAGATDNSWCGDGKIIAIWPDGTNTQQLTGSDGDTTDNHLLVDEKPADSDTTYVQGSTVDERDLYTFGACGITDANFTITRIWAEARSKDTVAAGGTIALVTKASGGSEVEGGTRSLLTTYSTRILSDDQLVNPVDGELWQAADVDALIAGPKTKS